MRAYYDFAYNLAASFLLDPDEAEDVAQETFIRAMKHIDHYQDGTSMKSWLGKITINLCRDRYRRRKTRQRLVDLLKMWIMPVAPETPNPEDALIQN
jgi:RNA polymerase sigma-70 factor (ECF subfamily)